MNLKLLIPRTWPTILFLSITIVQTIVDSTIIAILINSFEKNTTVLNALTARDENSILPVYLGLFILAHLFQFVLAVDAIAMRNMIQVLALLLFNTLFIVYSIIQITEINNSGSINGTALHVLVWFIPGMIVITEIVYLSTFWSIYKAFGWEIYKKIGADRSHKRMYLWYQIYVCILKFDCFFFLSFSLQLVLLVLSQSSLERYLTAGAVLITLVILLIGYYSVKNEIRSLALISLVGYALGAGYFVFKLFRIYQFRTTDYKLVYKSLTVFAALCLAALLWTFTTACICYKNFNAGLKWQMMKSIGEKNGSRADGHYKMEEAANNNYRMSMD